MRGCEGQLIHARNTAIACTLLSVMIGKFNESLCKDSKNNMPVFSENKEGFFSGKTTNQGYFLDKCKNTVITLKYKFIF